MRIHINMSNPEKIKSEATKYPQTPQEWFADFAASPISVNCFFTSLMDCVLTHEIPEVLRAVPANLFDEFKKELSDVARLPSEEDFVIIGRPVRWSIKQAREVLEWLDANPCPELAPPITKGKIG